MNVREILKRLRKDNGGTEYKSVNGKIYKRLKWLSCDKHWYFVAYISECVQIEDGRICANGGEIY